LNYVRGRLLSEVVDVVVAVRVCLCVPDGLIGMMMGVH
jgi:hypothetical protein